jgi:hypothetical protein
MEWLFAGWLQTVSCQLQTTWPETGDAATFFIDSTLAASAYLYITAYNYAG